MEKNNLLYIYKWTPDCSKSICSKILRDNT